METGIYLLHEADVLTLLYPQHQGACRVDHVPPAGDPVPGETKLVSVDVREGVVSPSYNHHQYSIDLSPGPHASQLTLH